MHSQTVQQSTASRRYIEDLQGSGQPVSYSCQTSPLEEDSIYVIYSHPAHFFPHRILADIQGLARPELYQSILGTTWWGASLDLAQPATSSFPTGDPGAQIAMAIDNEPVEDGVTHRAEALLAYYLDSDPDAATKWIAAAVLDPKRPAFGASVLRCLGRLAQPGTSHWRCKVIRLALGQADVELRDAAMQAAETWGEAEVIDILRHHKESVDWLRDYARAVIRDHS